MTAVAVKTMVHPWSAKGPNPMRVCGKDGITCPDIAAGGCEDVNVRVALATERSGRPLATQTPIVGAREL